MFGCYFQVQVFVEAPRELVTAGGLSSYSVETIVFDTWPESETFQADEDNLPPEVVRAELQGIKDASVGCHACGTMTLQIAKPNLWSAEKVRLGTFVSLNLDAILLL